MSTAIAIRFNDQDSQGHVNHAAIIEWMAVGRIDMFDGMIAEAGLENIDHVLVHIDADFISEITHPGVVVVHPSIFSIGKKSITLAYTLFKNGLVFATGKSVSVFFDTETKESVEVPIELRRPAGWATL